MICLPLLSWLCVACMHLCAAACTGHQEQQQPAGRGSVTEQRERQRRTQTAVDHQQHDLPQGPTLTQV